MQSFITSLVGPECDVSVSNFSVLKLFHSYDSFGFGIKKLVSKKVSDSVSEKFAIRKRIRFGIENIWYQKNSDLVSFRFWVFWETVSKLLSSWFQNFSIFWMLWIQYRKKIQYQKKLV